MCGERQRQVPLDDHGSCRRHHDAEQEATDGGGHHEHGRHHGYGHGRHGRHGLHSGRKLSAADLQLIIMAMLANQVSHGYELIKALEDHSHGLYVPSPGAIYPALTYLEEIGFANVETEGNRKRYSLTMAGQSHYAQNREVATRILSDMERIGAQMAQARQAVESGLVPENALSENSGGNTAGDELEAARRELKRAQRKEEPYTLEEIRRIAEILQRAALDIRRLLAASGETAV